MTGRFPAVCAVLALGFVAPMLAQQSSGVMAITLKPGEVIRTTTTGCRFIHAETANAYYSSKDFVWTGECRAGLVHGAGWLNDQKTIDSFAGASGGHEFVYGRAPPVAASTVGGVRTTTFAPPGQPHSVVLRGVSDALLPSWPADIGAAPNSVMLPTSEGQLGIALASRRCTTPDPRTMTPLELQANTGCDVLNNWFTVYDIEVTSYRAGGEPQKIGRYSCPSPRTPAGCEGLFNQQLAPYRSSAERLIAEARAANAALRAAGEAAFAAWRNAPAAPLAAGAPSASSPDAFRDSLNGLNVGQLFARADELAQAGDPDRARLARRTLLERFPESPLAITTAQLLAGVSAAAPVATSTPTPPAAAPLAASDGPLRPVGPPPPVTSADYRIACAEQIAAYRTAMQNASGGALIGEEQINTLLQTIPQMGESDASYFRNANSKAAIRADTPADVRARSSLEACLLNIRANQLLGYPAGQGPPTAAPPTALRGPAPGAPRAAAPPPPVAAGSTAPQRSSPPATPPAALPASTPAPAARAAFTAANGMSCPVQNTGPRNPAYLQFEKEVFDFEQTWKRKPDAGGSRDLYQYTIFLMTNDLVILEKHKPCLSAEDYTANKTFFENALTSAKRGCEATAAGAGAGACTPSYPANWGRP